MRRFVYQLVERLGDPDSGLSRNRHFATLSGPSGRRALKLHRHLAALESDLAKYGEGASIAVTHDADDLLVTVRVAALKLVRTARLSPEDLAVVRRRGGALASVIAGAKAEP